MINSRSCRVFIAGGTQGISQVQPRNRPCRPQLCRLSIGIGRRHPQALPEKSGASIQVSCRIEGLELTDDVELIQCRRPPSFFIERQSEIQMRRGESRIETDRSLIVCLGGNRGASTL